MKRLALVAVASVLLVAGCTSEASTPPPPPSEPVVPIGEPSTTSSSVVRLPLEGKVVAIDPGHNGGNSAHLADINRLVDAGNGVVKTCDTTGTATNDGYPEYEFTLSVAKDLQTRLEAQGAKVHMVRSDSAGWGPCITERARVGNDARADVAISIHGDGNNAPGARGFHVLVPQPTTINNAVVSPSNRFGELLRDEFKTTGMPVSNYLGTNGIMPRGDLGGLNLSVVPKVFIECGNMRNPTDATMMRSSQFQIAAAEAISAAIVKFLT